MNKFLSPHGLFIFCLGLLPILLLCSSSMAQSKVDLERKSPPPTLLRAGKLLMYTVTVTNKGTAKHRLSFRSMIIKEARSCHWFQDNPVRAVVKRMNSPSPALACEKDLTVKIISATAKIDDFGDISKGKEAYSGDMWPKPQSGKEPERSMANTPRTGADERRPLIDAHSEIEDRNPRGRLKGGCEKRRCSLQRSGTGRRGRDGA